MFKTHLDICNLPLFLKDRDLDFILGFQFCLLLNAGSIPLSLQLKALILKGRLLLFQLTKKKDKESKLTLNFQLGKGAVSGCLRCLFDKQSCRRSTVCKLIVYIEVVMIQTVE